MLVRADAKLLKTPQVVNFEGWLPGSEVSPYTNIRRGSYIISTTPTCFYHTCNNDYLALFASHYDSKSSIVNALQAQYAPVFCDIESYDSVYF